MSAMHPGEDRVFLDAVLQPHRSLPPRAFYLLMAGLACLSVVVGIICILVGAWPIFGFFGLDIALVYIAFKVSYRAARQREVVRLTTAALTVESVSAKGARRLVRFEPYWTRVRLQETAETNALTVGSHGQILSLGRFLAPEMRRRFAGQLLDALRRWRSFIEGRDTP